MNSKRSSRSLKTLSGDNAINRIIRFSRDQVVKTVKDRYTGKKAGANIARDMKTILSLVNTEQKQVYTLAVTQTVTNIAPLVYGIGTMAQGTASNQRTGDSVKITRIDLAIAFSFSTGTAATSFIQTQTFNWYLVRYLKTPSSGGTASFAITEFLNIDGNSRSTPLSFPNPDTNENFQLMGSGQVDIDLQYVPATDCAKSKVVTISHDCSFHQSYNGAGSSTITDNMVYLVFTAYSGANTGGASGVTVNAAMWYIDN